MPTGEAVPVPPAPVVGQDKLCLKVIKIDVAKMMKMSISGHSHTVLAGNGLSIVQVQHMARCFNRVCPGRRNALESLAAGPAIGSVQYCLSVLWVPRPRGRRGCG